MDFGFLAKATGIVFRESFEAVLIYGIIVSYFKKHESEARGQRAANTGLVLGVIASIVLGIALASSAPFFTAEAFSYVEIFIVFGGSMLMLYMVFWMSEHSKHLKAEIEGNLQKNSYRSIAAAVFIAVFREGIEAVVYLYSLVLEKSTISHTSGVLLSLAVGVLLAFSVYRLMLQGTKRLSLKAIFRVTAVWLLVSASSLLATSFDKMFAAGFFEKLSQPVFTIEYPGSLTGIVGTLESIFGIRAQPSPLQLAAFLIFWIFVVVKDPLKLRTQPQVPAPISQQPRS